LRVFESLKGKKNILLVINEGDRISRYQYELFIKPCADLLSLDNQKVYLCCLVSKKLYKRAVDRNYFKRVFREVIRALIKDGVIEKGVAIVVRLKRKLPEKSVYSFLLEDVREVWSNYRKFGARHC
jgi:ribonuclease P protein component